MLDRPSFTPGIGGIAAAAPLVLLPGTLCDGRVFAPVLSRIDSASHAFPLAGADTAREMARIVLARAPERMSLCGFSLGAIVALEIIAQAPGRVERLALIGCNPGVLVGEAAANRSTKTPDEFLADEHDPHQALLRTMAEDTPPQAFAQQTAITLSRADSRPRLSRIAVPTLVVCGAEDRICPPPMSIAMANAIPQARLAIVDGAGHYVMLERPDQVAHEVADWLARPASPLH